MRVLLIRHAAAEPRDPERWAEDEERPLTSRGARSAKRLATTLLKLEPGLSRVITSPAVRARDTAVPLAKAIGGEVLPETVEALGPHSTWRTMLGAIAALAEQDPECTIAVVGHEPDLGKLAGSLLFGAPTPMPFKKGGACAIDVDRAVAGAGQLVWWCPPRVIRALSRRRRGS